MLTTRLRPILISKIRNNKLFLKLFTLTVLCITLCECAPIIKRERRNVRSDVGAMVCIL